MLKKTVLIAENDRIVALDLNSILKRYNINSVIVDGNDGLLAQTRLLRPDLIIADYNIKNKEHFKKELADIVKNHHTPIIITTTSPKHKAGKYARTFPTCAVLTKPFDTTELLKLVQKFIFNTVSYNTNTSV